MSQGINFTAVCVADGLGIFLAAIVLGSRFWQNSRDRAEGILLRLMVVVAIFSCAADIAAFAFDGKTGIGAFLAVYLGNYWIYLSNMLMGSLWVLVLVRHIFGGKLPKSQIILTVILDAVGMLALFANCLTPLVFSVSAANVYARGPLFWIYMVIEAVFLADGIGAYFLYRRVNREVRYFPVWQFVIPILVGIMVQTFTYGISTIWPAVMVAVTGIVLGLGRERGAEADTLRQEKTRLEQIKGLASQYSVLYFVDLDTLETENYYLDLGGTPEEAKEIDRKSENFFSAFRSSMVLYAHPDFREDLLKYAEPEYVRSLLAEKRRHEFRFLCLNAQGVYAWTDMVLMKFSDGEKDRPVNIAVGYYDTDSETKASLEAFRRNERDLEAIRGLAGEFDTLQFVDLENDSYSLYYMVDDSPEAAKELTDESRRFSDYYRESMRTFCHPDYLEEMLSHADADGIRALLKDRNKYSCRFLCDSDRGWQWCEYALIRLDRETVPQRVAVGYTNIDEKVKQELEQQRVLTDALRAAEAASRAKTEFLFNMSHDIRTPMNAITGFVDKAIRHRDEPELRDDAMEKVKSSGEYLLRIVNDILDMAKIESGKLELNERVVCVDKADAALTEVFGAEAARKDIVLEVSHEAENRYLRMDESRMNQILANLLSNAVKYTDPGGRIRYSVRQLPCERSGFARFVLTVEDTGRGMSPEFLEKIFDAFEREGSAIRSGAQGTGLGMAIVKRLADAMGGTVTVESEPGKGTRVSVAAEYRIATAEEIAQYEAEHGGTTEKTQADFAGKRILLVEDNPLNREIAADLLEERGMLVDTAVDGVEAVELLKQAAEREDWHCYTAVLMDVQMPRMDGYEATKLIREIPVPEGIRLPIIAMTANAFEEDRQNAFAAGMDEHIAKPIDVSRLFEVLAKYV